MHARFNRGNTRKNLPWVQPIETIESRILLSGTTLDAWFGNNGIVPGYVADQVQLNGKILAHDSAGNAVRLNPDGSKDTSFNAATDMPASQPGIYQADGKRLVLDSSGVITRYNTDNSVDTSFGNGGHVSTYLQQPTRYIGQAPDPGDTPYQNMSFKPESIALREGSEIVVAGIVNGQTASGQRLHTQYGVQVLFENGAEDTGFGLVAYRTTNFDDVFPEDVFVANNYQIYIVGVTTNQSVEVANLGTDGFSGQDVFAGSGNEIFSGAAMGADGHLIVMTETVDSQQQPTMVLVTRFNADLSTDPALDNYQITLGHNPYDPSTNLVLAGDPMIGADDKVLVNATDTHGGVTDHYLVRFSNEVPDRTGSISGFIYNDVNGDGVHDLGDARLSYWQAFADINEDGKFELGEPTAYADYNGYFKMYGVAIGASRIYEIPQAEWMQDAPASTPYRVATVSSGGVATGNDFGNRNAGAPQSSSISGTFFYDSNANRNWDVGEAPSPYWGVYIDANNDGKYDLGDTELIANGAGQYTFKNLAPGTYVVRSTTASGWTQTYPEHNLSWSVTLGSGQAVTGINFGEYHGIISDAKASISGTFFYDSNANGVWDSGEPISPYWGVYIDANNDGIYDSGDTELIAGGKGQFTFPNLPAGTYVIRGTTASGWSQSYPENGGAQVVTLVAGQIVTGINFGEYHGSIPEGRTGSISGTFFYDSNANGVWDPGETYSPSWGVYIDANNDGVYDSGDTELITNAHGQYTFSNLSIGTYVVRATTASGWKQTFPANGGAQVHTLGFQQYATGIDFGVVRT